MTMTVTTTILILFAVPLAIWLAAVMLSGLAVAASLVIAALSAAWRRIRGD